jgi:hypothetical protein
MSGDGAGVGVVIAGDVLIERGKRHAPTIAE